MAEGKWGVECSFWVTATITYALRARYANSYQGSGVSRQGSAFSLFYSKAPIALRARCANSSLTTDPDSLTGLRG
ncbi:MAG: hypothetical protein F6K50_32790 [Moorea sp. SIO3I7]|uniref:hypothetical protein n=1 Tax=Moorena sp. SIO3I8 TaxID=2607833 RepID=UPI0013C0D53F|nr:hypothetical protein [Moorena sp. SIO3I8]NEO00075.1 hypothetical protein [Moorena sp. SIO3I7]NEO07513.1 hypothetical protein [Moorena sp. SIO3I8]